MMAFASRTRTRRTVAAMKQAGWGWMVGPLDCGGPILEGMPYALDNGAWPAFVNQEPWNELAFMRALQTYGRGAEFVVIPDVVADKEASLAATLTWLPTLLARPEIGRLLFAVQDGMTFEEVAPHVGGRVGVFIGGSTEWKEQAIIPWGTWARQRGCYCHVGRVNTVRRINLCLAAGADSFDGTSVTRFATTLPLLDHARHHRDLFSPLQ